MDRRKLHAIDRQKSERLRAIIDEFKNTDPAGVVRAGTLLSKIDWSQSYKRRTPEQHERLIRACGDPSIPRDAFITAITEPPLSYTTANYIAHKTDTILSVVDVVRLCDVYMGPNQVAPAKKVLHDQGWTIRYRRTILTGKSAGTEQEVDYLAARDLGFAYSALNAIDWDHWRIDPVTRLGRLEGKKPTTTDFVRGDKFKPLWRLMSRHGLAIRKGQLTVGADVLFDLPDAPPIYIYNERAIYDPVYEGAIDVFLERRKIELGL